MRRIFIISFSFFLVAFEVAFVSRFSFLTPLNLMLILLVYSAFFLDREDAIIFATASGLFLDLFSAWPFGVLTLMHLLLVLFVFFLSFTLFTNKSFYSWMALLILSSVLFGLLRLGVSSLLYFSRLLPWNIPINTFFSVIVVSVVYNMVGGMLLSLLVRLLGKWFFVPFSSPRARLH